MTTLNVNLTSALQTTLNQPGVWAYAVYFTDSGATANWTSLVANGEIQGGGTTGIALPAPYVSGKVYFLVVSGNIDGTTPSLGITTESDINWDAAASNNYRYDSFEVTLSAPTATAANDQGNLTSVNAFGLPMGVQVNYSDGTATRGYNTTGSALFTELAALSPGGASPSAEQQVVFTYDGGSLDGDNRMAIAPSTALGEASGPGSAAFTASYWDAYLGDVSAIADDVQIAGFFNGAMDANSVWHNGGFYNYTLAYDADTKFFTLNPTGNSEIKGSITLSSADLANSIFSTLGTMDILTASGTTFLSENSGWNDQWGAVMTQVLTGFTGGYYGTTGAYSVSGQSVDLNQNWNWDPTFAFGSALSSKSTNHTFDPYAQIFFAESNSYGAGYSDNLTAQFDQGGPLVSVADSASADVASIGITIFDDSEDPSSFYTDTVIYNQIAEPGGGWQQPDATSGLNFKMNFSYLDMILDPKTELSIDIYEEDGSGNPVWVNVPLAAQGADPWGIWTITKDQSDGDVPAFSATLGGADQGTGQLLISGLPADSAGTYWYRINVGSGADKKTFNLYTKIADNSGSLAFQNPAYAGQAGSLAIDGLAKIAPQASTAETIETFTVNFISGGTIAVDPDLLIRDTDRVMNPTVPNAPVAGTLDDGDFTALAGQTTAANAASISASDGDLAFAWTGQNNAPGASAAAWMSGYTNKIGATNTALVSIAAASGLSISPLAAVAGLDGAWTTGISTLSNGTYTVSMAEFAASDVSYETPLGGTSYKSQTLTVAVDIAELGLLAGGDGSLALDGSSSSVGGNWLAFQSINAASLPIGTTILLYATDENGLLVDPLTGEAGGSVTLDDATLGSIGSIRSDSGGILMNGQSHVYLDAEHRLKFAIMSESGTVTLDAPVSIVPGGSGGHAISVGGYELSVEADNDLSNEAVLASAQRQLQEEMIYVESGQTLRLEVAGSAANVNQLGFVEFDIDPGTGSWSVDGVAYSDSQAFSDKVLASLDGGITLSAGGGDFNETALWTVEGDSGFYAPVLITPSGEVFVIGDANPGGNEQIRSFGNNLFGFEDMTEDEGSDFDYNDMVMLISPVLDAGV